MRLDIIHEADDHLSRKSWGFWLRSDTAFVLSEYSEDVRLTKRHKFRTRKAWSRVDNRYGIKRDSFDVPPDVIESATSRYRAMIHFGVSR